jgi:hypothetical protein
MRAKSAVHKEVHAIVTSLCSTIPPLDDTVLTPLSQQWNPLFDVVPEYVQTIWEDAASKTVNDIMTSSGLDLKRIK